jgi:RNA polymerase-binding transcription factor DksA
VEPELGGVHVGPEDLPPADLDQVFIDQHDLDQGALDKPELDQPELDQPELDIDGSVLDTIERELADVERALALLDEGGYGLCEHCGAVIDDDVLVRTPTARFCPQHLPLTLR